MTDINIFDSIRLNPDIRALDSYSLGQFGSFPIGRFMLPDNYALAHRREAIEQHRDAPSEKTLQMLKALGIEIVEDPDIGTVYVIPDDVRCTNFVDLTVDKDGVFTHYRLPYHCYINSIDIFEGISHCDVGWGINPGGFLSIPRVTPEVVLELLEVAKGEILELKSIKHLALRHNIINNLAGQIVLPDSEPEYEIILGPRHIERFGEHRRSIICIRQDQGRYVAVHLGGNIHYDRTEDILRFNPIEDRDGWVPRYTLREKDGFLIR